ncbi:benenodin family lasso peptide [Sphingobium yanoikuyae]|uniref:Benenodin family lasso peptide n=1 Tax=Sphingobium yanoikuyae TaxID=13690 RepID=A0A430BQ65_SPHYA|nr:benenodin family lasso peptide [Sphingobium yanoikuyae]
MWRQKEANMEREYDKSSADVIELGVASAVTNGVGQGSIDLPAKQQAPGILDD